jgi:hypothetical protein
MQIATIAPKPPVTNLIAEGRPGPGPHNPLGVTSYGEMKVGHALNGIAYTTHKLLGPLAPPVATFTGSLQDAITGAQAFVKDYESRADGRIAVALLGDGHTWNAQFLFGDQTVLRAIDNGPGTGGIASIEFTSVSRSLGALVTATGSLLPGQLRKPVQA